MFIYLVCIWKTRLWTKVIDSWLSLFKKSNIIGWGFIRAGFISVVRVAILIKIFKSISFFCNITLAFIYYIFRLFITLTLAYWLFLSSRLTFDSRNLNQVVFFILKFSITYSAFVDERAIVVYFFEYQLTRPPFNMKIKLNVNFLVAWFLAQLESK